MDNPSPLPLRILSTSHKSLECPRCIGEAADALASGVVGVDECTVKGDAGGAAGEEKRVRLSGL